MDKQQQQRNKKPSANDGYKGAKDSNFIMILTDKDGKQTTLKR